MKRYVYCPPDGDFEFANVLSKKVSLPLLIGDNDHTLSLEFDRSIVSVIKVPENKEIVIANGTIKKGFHQSIKYINEFKLLKNNIDLYVNDIKVKSLYQEQHVVKFNYLCESEGEKSCIIFVSGQKEEEFSFVVD